MRLPLVCLLVLLFLGSARAAEPFFKKNDVIALIGGEDMVVAGEDGYLETLIMRALPDYNLRFRSLAFEGDTVFEQNRDLNFPTWEEALDKIGATVVICQFGQMESLAGKDKIPEFLTAYGKLIDRFSAGGKRRIIILAPSAFAQSAMLKTNYRTAPPAAHLEAKSLVLLDYVKSIEQFARDRHALFLNNSLLSSRDGPLQRDGVHLTDLGQNELATDVAFELSGAKKVAGPHASNSDPLLQLIRTKNRLWYDYWRVQNWAFLAGDRTNQPSSRDWKDPSKRWFPAEREEFLPLIATKEKEINALAEKLK